MRKQLIRCTFLFAFLLFAVGFTGTAAQADQITRTQYDKTYGVKSTTTVYFTTVPYRDGNELYKITKVKGKIQVLSGSLQVLKPKIRLGQVGPGPSKSGNLTGQIKDYTISGKTLSYTIYPPKTWKPVLLGSPYSRVGATVTATIKRGTKTWSFKQTNAQLK
ncbi:hypothetical protein [Bacillus sp. V5-8f]|uniref:hypothetical protein n=1 Tax=Bacillus sp. V5-8f TaxID=2053044 RepID=UPI000C76446B|nr:hypothetical protein [Bacillus sp. V5-8f]PLT32060.1 hypothetical protein CUU64_21060 [Bacillus sp. V5-8f]